MFLQFDPPLLHLPLFLENEFCAPDFHGYNTVGDCFCDAMHVLLFNDTRLSSKDPLPLFLKEKNKK